MLAIVGTGTAAASPVLSRGQSELFRAWLVRILDHEVRAGPTPRWVHRDCAGLVRFAVAESLRAHDERWRQASGVAPPLPPELVLTAEQQELRDGWTLAGGERAAYVGALELVQENATFVSKDLNQAAAGDLLFFDQGESQHLMVWTGRYLAYHTGGNPGEDGGDDGLRAISPGELMQGKDTRWQPRLDNPNFIGVFRLRFLAP